MGLWRLRGIWCCALPLCEIICSSFISAGKVFYNLCNVAGIINVYVRCIVMVSCSVHSYMWKNRLFLRIFWILRNKNFHLLVRIQRLQVLLHLLSNYISYFASLLSRWMRFIWTQFRSRDNIPQTSGKALVVGWFWIYPYILQASKKAKLPVSCNYVMGTNMAWKKKKKVPCGQGKGRLVFAARVIS